MPVVPSSFSRINIACVFLAALVAVPASDAFYVPPRGRMGMLPPPKTIMTKWTRMAPRSADDTEDTNEDVMAADTPVGTTSVASSLSMIAAADANKPAVPEGMVSLGRLLEFIKFSFLPVSLVCLYQATTTATVTEDAAMATALPLRAAIMTGMYGGYGVLWLIKSYTFPDLRFYNKFFNKAEAVGVLAFLGGGFSLFPYVASHNAAAPLATADATVALLLFAVGVFFHYAADAQKYFVFQTRHGKRGLITDGLFSRTRNPSYFGEWCIWTALVLIAGKDQPLAWIPFALTVGITFIFAIEKDKSLSRYPEFAEWKNQTGLVFPKLF